MRILVDDLTHVYTTAGSARREALRDVGFAVEAGEFTAILGATGSGKTTLIQHLNGLLKPTSGTVVVDDMDLTDRRTDLREVRRRVGLVFQYPEQQLFEETVEADVAFGPKNLELSSSQVEERVVEALERVGLDHAILKRSPFELSGGEKRRVAIAGVLAMRPEVLILDEPTAGLDPAGRVEILQRIAELHRAGGLTVLLVSHRMEDVARYAHRALVLSKGRLVVDGPLREVFALGGELRGYGLTPPVFGQVLFGLRARGVPVHTDALTAEEAAHAILDALHARTLHGETGAERR